MKYGFLLGLLLLPGYAAAVDTQELIKAYYHCGMSKYLPGSGAFLSKANEEPAATNVLTNHCAKEYGALKASLMAFEKEHQKLETALAKGTNDPAPLVKFSASETLRGHLEYARDQVRLLMRLDRFASCWTFKAGEYVRGTDESAEAILDASVLACSDDRERLREMTKVVYLTDTDAQLERGVQIARQRVTKYILDERLKRRAK